MVPQIGKVPVQRQLRRLCRFPDGDALVPTEAYNQYWSRIGHSRADFWSALDMQETAEKYRQRMFALVDGKDPVKLQSAAPARLAKLLKGVSPARARKRPSPDKWSIAEIVVHLADTEVV